MSLSKVLELAVAIYAACDQQDSGKCETCRLNDRQRVGDYCICAYLSLAEQRATKALVEKVV